MSLEHFSRYFVRDADGNVDDVYDGDDDRELAHEMAKAIGGYVNRLDYISDGDYVLDTLESIDDTQP